MIICKSLYGLKSAEARWHKDLSPKLRKMGFTPSKADADLWYKDRGDHYEYVAIYVDDLLIWSRKPTDIIKTFGEDFELKGVGIPKCYLEENVEFFY